ncbi:MAG: hypothetical protein DYG94_13610 [Leptolyngbya sp. PLA3]|nr:MAG: hypothetical protein EDM82_14165 [Cyanobacteria bacterium CYA]MCE7969763.1 hypothetical protein [Leptolyngbya sp. PL-A3]
MWSSAAPIDVRAACVAHLLDDPDAAGQMDARAMANLMLPTERSRTVVSVIAARAGQYGWKEMTSALVRSYARPVEGVEDDQRAERVALMQLHPDRPLAEVLFEVFLDPGYEDTPAELRLNQRTRADVWDLLGRVDESGALRRGLIQRAQAGDVPDSTRASVRALQRALENLSVVPRTGDELRWIESLNNGSAENERWWSQASGAVSALSGDRGAGLEMRHIEPIRWASQHRPELLARSREELLDELSRAVEGRTHVKRTAEQRVLDQPRRERLSDWAAQLTWSDLVAIHVIDIASRDPGVVKRLYEQVDIDRQDRTTEYGGVIEPSEGSSFRILLFRPRVRDRNSDTEFVASEDMIRYADRALAFYHQHVQSGAESKHAGPSEADLVYAARSGRSCVVFTAVGKSGLNVDYYQPNGVVIDLGTVGDAEP